MKGSCLCGKIRFEIQALLPDIANCHCSMFENFMVLLTQLMAPQLQKILNG